MTAENSPLNVGPLFPNELGGNSPAEKIVDENDHAAADEAMWLKNHEKMAASLIDSDYQFVQEFSLRTTGA